MIWHAKKTIIFSKERDFTISLHHTVVSKEILAPA